KPQGRGVEWRVQHVQPQAPRPPGQEDVLPREPQRPDLALRREHGHHLGEAAGRREELGVAAVDEEDVPVRVVQSGERRDQLYGVAVVPGPATHAGDQWKKVDADPQRRHPSTASYTSAVSRAVRSQGNSRALASPRAVRSWARPSSSHTRRIPSAIASTDSGSTSTAASPATSGSDERSEVTTGHPHAIASSTGRPKPSNRDGYTSKRA